MAAQKKPQMSREQAEQLYKDLKARMVATVISDSLKDGKDGKAKAKPAAAAAKAGKPQITPEMLASLGLTGAKAAGAGLMSQAAGRIRRLPGNRGHYGAIVLVILCACFRVVLSALDALNVTSAKIAEASYVGGQRLAPVTGPQFSKEEVKVLTQLDTRRAELEERSKRLDTVEEDLAKRDREFAARFTQLRELTDKLKLEREKNEKKDSSQLDQLASVYSSMAPEEAAHLIDQLDPTIALSLIRRLPEKRMGQVLAAMTPERALMITKMLSGMNP